MEIKIKDQLYKLNKEFLYIYILIWLKTLNVIKLLLRF